MRICQTRHEFIYLGLQEEDSLDQFAVAKFCFAHYSFLLA